MGAVKLSLEHKSPSNVNGVTFDPKPDWTFDDLISELHSLQLKQSANMKSPVFVKNQPRDFPKKSKAFVMRVSDFEDAVSDDEENQDPNMVVVGKRFGCADFYVSDSDSSEDELALEGTQVDLMDPVGLLEGLLYERELEHQSWVEEAIRHKIDLLEMDMLNENGRFTSAHLQLERLAEARREMDRKLDTQYRRTIAEALDNHLIAVQRKHEHKSQIEERKIRNDAAFEEGKRKEKAIQEEKVRQEKAKAKAEAEAEALKRRAEEEQKEAERQAKKEAEVKKNSETTERHLDEVRQKDLGSKPNSIAEPLQEIRGKDNSIRSADRALKVEAERQQKYNDLVQKNELLRLSSNKDQFRSFEQQIGRHIKQIAGSRENLRRKANELINIINNPSCPHSISVATFAKKMVTRFETVGSNFDSTAFACGHVIVLVTSQAPLAMDIFLAELHRACIYTVPKHIVKQMSGLNEEAYLKALGYQEENGKIESKEQYLSRLESYMKLYGALVQTDIDNVPNPHVLDQGWAWLARLLNSLPANVYTAVALNAFLKEIIKALPKSLKIVDLSADFRLRNIDEYEEWYGQPHKAPDLQKEAVYGLTEVLREDIRNARLVANPGCYPTSIQIPLVPLIKAKLIELRNIIIDAKSGVSGAGRGAKEANLYTEIAEGIHSYGITKHRHVPEIEQGLADCANSKVTVSFTPHLMPMSRGMQSTIYVEMAPGNSVEDLYQELKASYEGEEFVVLLEKGVVPHTRNVRGSNYCFMNVYADRISGRAIIISVIDNLVKGASGQAIQNLNLMMGLPESTGLLYQPLFP